jgi:hypothetical protein
MLSTPTMRLQIHPTILMVSMMGLNEYGYTLRTTRVYAGGGPPGGGILADRKDCIVEP